MKDMKLLGTLFLILISSITFAQDVPFEKDYFKDDKDGLKDALSAIKEGDKIFDMGPTYYKDAKEFYQKAQDFNPNNARNNYRLGACYLMSVDKFKALPFLKKAEQLNPNIDRELYYYLGQAYNYNHDFDDIEESYNLTRTCRRTFILICRKRCMTLR